MLALRGPLGRTTYRHKGAVPCRSIGVSYQRDWRIRTRPGPDTNVPEHRRRTIQLAYSWACYRPRCVVQELDPPKLC